jgi:hypothetical protein
VREVIVGQEADRFSYGLGTAGTADPVDIIFWMTGEVVIDDVGNAFHIDSTCSDVGRNKDPDTAGLKILECTKTLILRAVGVKCRTRDTEGFKTTGNSVSSVFCAGKDEYGLHGFIFQKMGKEGGFGVVGYLEQVLGHRFCRIRATPDFNQFRVMHEFPGQPLDFPGKSGGKEQGLTLPREKPDDLTDVRDESHVEHSIGFVENQELEGS